METTVKNIGIEYTYNQVEINKIVNNTVNKIKNFVIANNYQVKGNMREYQFNNIPLSKRQMKKIQKYCFWIEKNPTLRNINSFYGLLSRTYGVERVRIEISLKEQKIQAARKEWIIARNKAEVALEKYKAEKGDFYK